MFDERKLETGAHRQGMDHVDQNDDSARITGPNQDHSEPQEQTNGTNSTNQEMGRGKHLYEADETSMSMAAAQEWEKVPARELAFSSHSLHSLDVTPDATAAARGGPAQRRTPPGPLLLEAVNASQRIRPCTPEEIVAYLHQSDLTPYLSKIVVERPGSTAVRRFLKRWLCCGHPSVKQSLRLRRDAIFATALRPYDNSDPFHFRLLATLREHLTGEPSIQVSRYGSHWTEIGWQGSDPATDLRGVGLLGLINLAYFVASLETRSLAKDIYRISTDYEQNFPFCAMGTNVTQMTIHTLRSGQLNGLINASRDPFGVFTAMYAAIYGRLYDIWVTQHKTVMDSGFVISELKDTLRRDASLVFKQSKSIYRSGPAVGHKMAAKRQNNNESEFVTFSDIGGIFD